MKRRQIPQLCPIYTLLSSPFLALSHALFSFKSYLTTYIFSWKVTSKLIPSSLKCVFILHSLVTFLYKLVKELNTWTLKYIFWVSMNKYVLKYFFFSHAKYPK
jgi:hypothetical protein